MSRSRLLPVLLGLVVAGPAHAAGWLDAWLTPDQQAQRLLQQGQYAEAASKFSAPERMGYAWFRAGEFERAAAAYGRVPGAEGAYNRGNALLMLGRYGDAIASYQNALAERPEWREARENLEIARIRQARLAPPGDDAGGTGGKLQADEIVFDTSGRVAGSEAEQVLEGPEGAMSEEALRALWLRRVDTGPGRFLAIRFQYQLARQEQESGDE
jgi:Ca-activated chloride channel family protein